jgi:hypothetical protein
VDHLVAKVEPGWAQVPFVQADLEKWLKDATAVSERTGVDVLDLFYWEHRMGGWQAQSQLEWDIVQEAYTPFNHRRLLETMLAVPSQLRCLPDVVLYKEMCRAMWPQVLDAPINPEEPISLEEAFKLMIDRMGLGNVARAVYARLKTLR